MEIKYHYPFIRQIKDFYRYQAQGNIFLEVDINFRRIDLNKINSAIRKLHQKYTLLNCRFILENDIIYLKELPQNNIDYFRTLPEESETKNPNEYFHPIRIENQSLSIYDAPLMYFHIFRHKEMLIFKIFAHHMICDANGLQKIKNDLIDYYGGAEVTEVFDFGQYAVKRNSKLFKTLESDQKYWINILKEYDGTIIKEIDYKCFNDLNYDDKIKSLVKDKYYTLVDDYSKKGQSYFQAFTIQNFAEIQNIIKKKGISWVSIFMHVFAKTIYPYQGKSLIGLLVSGKNDIFSINSIGEYSGECFYPAADYPLSTDEIIKTAKNFMTLSKHLVYNYALLKWDEEKFFRKICKSFINLSVIDFNVYEEEKINTFENIDLIFLELEPLFFLSKSDGSVYVNWRFNTSVTSTEQMKQIADDFSNTFNECSKTICEENIMIDEKV